MLTPNARACLRRAQHPGHKLKRLLVALCVLCTLAATLGVVICWSRQEAPLLQTVRTFPTEAALSQLVEQLSHTCEGLEAEDQPYSHVAVQEYRFLLSPRCPVFSHASSVAGKGPT